MRSFAAIGVALLVSAARPSGIDHPARHAQDLASRPSASTRRDSTLKTARSIMQAARFCDLITIGPEQQPQARVVDPLSPDDALAVYIATNPKSRKVAEIAKDPRVTLLYFDPARPAYVTLIGRATEVRGDEKARHRKADWNAFFAPDKPDTYVLYKVTPSRIEVVSAKDGLSGDPSTWRPEIVELK